MAEVITTNIQEVIKKTKRLKRISEKYVVQLERAMDKAKSVVESRTPRSTGTGSQKGKHLADGWTLLKVGGGKWGSGNAIFSLFNRFTHNADGKPRGAALLPGKEYTLLEVLEYGSPPHVITPRNKTILRWEVDGSVVWAKRVMHPGTRPYAMIRVARERLKRDIQKINKRIAKQIGQEWKS